MEDIINKEIFKSKYFQKTLLVFLVLVVMSTSVVGFLSYNFSSDYIIDLSEKQLSILVRQISLNFRNIIRDVLDDIPGRDMDTALMWAMTDIETELEEATNNLLAPLDFESNIYLVADDEIVSSEQWPPSIDFSIREEIKGSSFYEEIQEVNEDEFIAQTQEAIEKAHEESGARGSGFDNNVRSSGQVEFQRGEKDLVAFFSQVEPMGWYVIVEILEEELYAPQRFIRNVIILISIIIMFIAGIVAYLFAKRSADPINKVSNNLEKLSNGDYTNEIKSFTNRKDEIGKLIQNYNKLIVNQKNMIEKIKNVTNDLEISSDKLNGVSLDFIKNTDDTLEDINQISASTQELSATNSEVVAMSEQTNSTVENGNKKIKDLNNQMSNIKTKVYDSVEEIKVLNQKSDKIEEIIELISNIADQTDLLALNAAIEAARAGEAGQGFAVVAEEVRELAKRSSQAGQKISKLIEEIQDKTKDTTESIREVEQEVEKGEKTIQKTSGSFAEIKTASNETTMQMENASQATNELAESTTEAIKKIEKLEGLSEDVKENGEQLQDKSDVLKDLVEEFKI